MVLWPPFLNCRKLTWNRVECLRCSGYSDAFRLRTYVCHCVTLLRQCSSEFIYDAFCVSCDTRFTQGYVRCIVPPFRRNFPFLSKKRYAPFIYSRMQKGSSLLWRTLGTATCWSLSTKWQSEISTVSSSMRQSSWQLWNFCTSRSDINFMLYRTDVGTYLCQGLRGWTWNRSPFNLPTFFS